VAALRWEEDGRGEGGEEGAGVSRGGTKTGDEGGADTRGEGHGELGGTEAKIGVKGEDETLAAEMLLIEASDDMDAILNGWKCCVWRYPLGIGLSKSLRIGHKRCKLLQQLIVARLLKTKGTFTGLVPLIIKDFTERKGEPCFVP